jgi:signal transduction histidine kinase
MRDAIRDAGRPAFERVKFLLVDDLDENLLAMSALLQRDDVELLQARSGREALELLLQHDVALALLDVQMPEMDGFQLAELMRGSERTRHVPIIFVTAGAGDRHRQFAGYRSGAVDFLSKPIEPHVLQSKADVFVRMHRQQQQLARELRERTETLRLNEMFIAMLGHDLRAPLNTIALSGRLLQAGAGETSKAPVERIVRNAGLMNRMIGDILDLARSRLGQGLAVQRRETDIGALLDHAVQERRSERPDARIAYARHGDTAGRWDADRITQLANNLLVNALTHGADGAVDVTLDGRDPQQVVLAVRNAGAIPPTLLPHIFDPFRRERASHGASGGLGLGLYIVQQIVQAHEGSVDVASNEEDGTRFIVRLPRG